MASSSSTDIEDPDEGTDFATGIPADECEQHSPPPHTQSFPSSVRWARPALGLDNFS